MSGPGEQRLIHRDLTDRELLLLIAERVDNALPVIDRRLEAQSADIRDLKKWRYYSAGAAAALLALFGIRTH